ncbi:hypothetical protein UFOVP536_44 [uncultured Caudovirales phage]|uniref:Uncharacterized protein n=1 Tax=uncultured Caudovirales phage TaxID=2100421 RepID=A0A6J5MVH9_9CAUD|nr:hypothetical protein UFOVP536_44 [uncultured Caudovirales phage]
MFNMDAYSKALLEVGKLKERQRVVELLQAELLRVSDGVFDAKGVLKDLITGLEQDDQ